MPRLASQVRPGKPVSVILASDGVTSVIASRSCVTGCGIRDGSFGAMVNPPGHDAASDPTSPYF